MILTLSMEGVMRELRFDYYNPVSIVEQNINEGNDTLFLGSLKGTLILALLQMD